jgi:hypothetical protein
MSKAIARSLDSRAGNLQQQLKDAENVFEQILAFATLGKIPDDMTKDFRALSPWGSGGELEFFNETKGQPIFFYLIGKLTSKGINSEDALMWEKLRASQFPQQGTSPLPPGAPVAGEISRRGKMEVLGSGIRNFFSSIGDLLAPDLSGIDGVAPLLEDPFDHLAKLYKSGVVYCDVYGKGSAIVELRDIRVAIATHAGKLLRELRFYINEKVERTGDQLTRVVSA